MSNRQNDYVTAARRAATKLADAVNELLALQPEWNALDYGNTETGLLAENFIGVNAEVTPSEIGSVVFATADAIQGLFAQGHGTNVYAVYSKEV